MLDLASDLLFFWGGGASWLDRDLDWGYQAVHCAGSLDPLCGYYVCG